MPIIYTIFNIHAILPIISLSVTSWSTLNHSSTYPKAIMTTSVQPLPLPQPRGPELKSSGSISPMVACTKPSTSSMTTPDSKSSEEQKRLIPWHEDTLVNRCNRYSKMTEEEKNSLINYHADGTFCIEDYPSNYLLTEIYETKEFVPFSKLDEKIFRLAGLAVALMDANVDGVRNELDEIEKREGIEACRRIVNNSDARRMSVLHIIGEQMKILSGSDSRRRTEKLAKLASYADLIKLMIKYDVNQEAVDLWDKKWI